MVRYLANGGGGPVYEALRLVVVVRCGKVMLVIWSRSSCGSSRKGKVDVGIVVGSFQACIILWLKML